MMFKIRADENSQDWPDNLKKGTFRKYFWAGCVTHKNANRVCLSLVASWKVKCSG